MKQFFRLFFFLFTFTSTINPLNAVIGKEAKDTQKDLRILELLPNLLCPLAIDPGIPAHFIALSRQGVLDPSDWIYWGPKDVLEAYFKDPSSLKEPILRVKLSLNVAQSGPKEFNGSNAECIKILKGTMPAEFSSLEHQWGVYPILSIRTTVEDKVAIFAWVGLNDAESGWTLLFNLVYPDKKGHPNKEDCAFWNNFIMETNQLVNGDYFKACGQDLQDGFTLVNMAGTKLKILAERRQKDDKLQVVVVPQTPNTEFHYINMEEGFMGAPWKHGEPMIKVHGEIVKCDGNNKNIINYFASIFIKTVSEFSIEKENKEDDKNYLFILK